MKNIWILALVCLILTSCKKKDDDPGDGNTSTKGSVTFFTYLKNFEAQDIVNGADVKVGTDEASINAGTVLYSGNTDASGNIKFEDIEQGSYFFIVSFTDGPNSYSAKGSLTISGGQGLTKSVPLDQISGLGTLRFRITIPSLGSDSLVEGARVDIDTSFTNLSSGGSMFNTLSNASGVAEFTNLNPETYYCKFAATVNSVDYDTTGAVILPADELVQHFSIILK